MEDRLRIGIGLLGYQGGIADVYASVLRQYAPGLGMNLVLKPKLVPRTTRELRKTPSAELHDAMFRILQNDGIAAVMLVDPLGFPSEFPMDVIESGKYLFIHAPAAQSAAACDAIARAALCQRSGLFFGYPARFAYSMAHAKKYLASEFIREIRVDIATDLRRARKPLPDEGFPPGALWEQGVEAASLLTYLFPGARLQPLSTTCGRPENFSFETKAEISFGWTDFGGGTGLVSLDTLAKHSQLLVACKTDHDTLMLDFEAGTFSSEKDGPLAISPNWKNSAEEKIFGMMEYFCGCIKPRLCNASVEPVQFIEQADAGKTTVELEPLF